MTCRHAELQLNALADRELNSWQAARVRRHLAACPACAAEFAEIQRLDATVHAWRDLPAPSELGSRIAAALPSSAAFRTRRRTFPVRPAAVGLAGIAAAVAAIFWFLPGQPGQPTIAFADVQKAMQQVQVIGFTIYVEPPHAAEHRFKPSIVNTAWVRRNPPAVAQFRIGRFKPNVVVARLEDSRGYFYRTTQGKCRLVPGGKRWISRLTEEVEASLKLYTEQPTPKSYSNGDGYNVVTQPQQRIVALRGRKCILFTYREDISPRKGGQLTLKPQYHSCGSIWVDPKTRLVVRMETYHWHDKSAGSPQSFQMTITDNFHYNRIPPSVFDWSLKGVNVIHSER